jgi:hypothetical protein
MEFYEDILHVDKYLVFLLKLTSMLTNESLKL